MTSTQSAVKPGVKLFPDETLDAALRLLAVQPEIQVVSRLQSEKVLGVLTLNDVYRAYGLTSGEPQTTP
jgi:CBS domain-containing protein